MSFPCRLVQDLHFIYCQTCGNAWAYGALNLDSCQRGASQADVRSVSCVQSPVRAAYDKKLVDEARADLFRKGWKEIPNWDGNWDQSNGWLSPEDQEELRYGKRRWWNR